MFSSGSWLAARSVDAKAESTQTHKNATALVQAVHGGKGLDWDGVVYTPTIYREKPGVEADIRVGMSLWHFLEEDHGAGRCYHGTVKAVRGAHASVCVVEYDVAERFPESSGRNPTWGGGSHHNGPSASPASPRRGAGRHNNGSGGGGDRSSAEGGGWSGAGARLDSGGGWTGGVRAASCEEVRGGWGGV